MLALTTPTFCMHAYTLVDPMKQCPCALSCLERLSASGVVVGTSAADRGARLRLVVYESASATRFGEADLIALALSMVAWILARLRMIDGSCSRRSTSRSVIAETLATSKPWKACRKASRLPKTTDQLSPTSNTPK